MAAAESFHGRRLMFVLCGLLAAGLVAGCGSSPESDPPPTSGMVEAGSWYSRQQWPHDGNPHESANFVVFGDRSSEAARSEVAVVAEEIWAELLDDFDIQPGMLRFPADQDKVHIYAYRDYYPQRWGMRAYYAGLIMWSPDHPYRPTAVDAYGPVVRHELVHVIEGLLKGRKCNEEPVTDVWFCEGLAEAVAGGTAGGAIRGRAQLDSLTAEYGTVSPIWFKRDAQVVIPGAGYHYNYPMYQLAVEYLLADAGIGATYSDVRDTFLAMAEGTSFAEAFEANLGIDVDDYERQFFDRMDGYLPPYRTLWFSPVPFALFSLGGALVLGAALIVCYRRGRSDGTAVDGDPPWGRVVRAGVCSEVVLATGLVLAVFLGLLFVIGTEYDLNNAMNASERTSSLWLLAGYLVVSIGILLWAARRWARRSPAVLFSGPLVVAATVATIFALSIVT